MEETLRTNFGNKSDLFDRIEYFTQNVMVFMLICFDSVEACCCWERGRRFGQSIMSSPSVVVGSGSVGPAPSAPPPLSSPAPIDLSQYLVLRVMRLPSPVFAFSEMLANALVVPSAKDSIYCGETFRANVAIAQATNNASTPINLPVELIPTINT